MKHISTIFISIISISLLSLVGCKKEVFMFMSTEERIVGEWTFEKVEYRKEFSLKRENITSEYQNQKFIFNEDLTMSTLNLETEMESIGDWEIDCYYDNFDDDSQTTEFLTATYRNVDTGECSELDWDNISVRKKVMCASERKNGRIYFYELKRE